MSIHVHPRICWHAHVNCIPHTNMHPDTQQVCVGAMLGMPIDMHMYMRVDMCMAYVAAMFDLCVLGEHGSARETACARACARARAAWALHGRPVIRPGCRAHDCGHKNDVLGTTRAVKDS